MEAELAPAGKPPPPPELRDALLAATRAVGLAVEEEGMHLLVGEIVTASAVKAEPHARAAAAALACAVCKESALDMGEYLHLVFQATVTWPLHDRCMTVA